MKTKLKSLRLNKKGVKLVKKVDKPIPSNIMPFTNLIYLSILLNVIAIFAVLFFKKSLPAEVPLFYGLPEGEDQLTKSNYLIIAPTLSFAILGLNLILTSIVKGGLLKKMLVTAGFFVSLFSFITLTQIFFLIGPF